MKVSKQQVVEFIRARGDEERAGEAERELPDSVDVGLLAQYGVTEDDLTDEGAWG
jgi:hypothetical protein